MAAATFLNSSATRIFSDVAGDITISVDGDSFLLHKLPLVSRSGRIRKMLADNNVSKLDLLNFPGGPQAFKLAMKFCYGINLEITPQNVAHLRCAADYLEMTEDSSEENLIARSETYLNEVVLRSLDKSVAVLSSCESLPPVAEEVGIPDRCVDAIAMNACKEQLVSTLSGLDCDGRSTELKRACVERWIEHLSVLKIAFYQRVIIAMGRVGIRQDSIVASLMHYAQASLKPSAGLGESEQRTIVETIISLLPTEKSSSVPLSFMFGMLRMAVMGEAAMGCRLELERRIASRLEMVSLDDLLIPSLQPRDSLFDVDSVYRMLVNFLQRIEEEEECGYESEGLGSPGHGALLKVGRLIDAYLAEIAPDPFLSLDKFIAMIEILPNYARLLDDGLYRAMDIYLKAHPALTEDESKKLFKFIDCQKLSQEACNHAAQNDRVPMQMAVRVLYFEQLHLKNALSGSSGDGFMSQRMSSGIPSAAMSPRDNYASLRRENRELKLEVSRMRVRLSELEKEQTVMKQDMISKSGNGRTFLASLSKGIGRIGIFSIPGGNRGRKKIKQVLLIWKIVPGAEEMCLGFSNNFQIADLG